MKFTVVIPLYNKEKHISRAIKSVINQTYQEFEIVVINDGSTDNSVLEIKKISDSRIKLITQKNSGVSSARNKGIGEAIYDYIGFLDADDEWKPNFLEKIKELIQEYPNAGAYATRYEIKSENGVVSKSLSGNGLEDGWKGIIDDYFKHSLTTPLISASSVVIPRRVFEHLGGFPVGIKRGEDLDMWLRIALNYEIAYSNQVCATYFHDTENRACKMKSKLTDSAVNFAEDTFIGAKELANQSIYFEEYMIKKLIIKSRYLIDEGNSKEARKLLYKYKYTRLNKKLLIKTYIMSYLPKPLLNIMLYFKSKTRSNRKYLHARLKPNINEGYNG